MRGLVLGLLCLLILPATGFGQLPVFPGAQGYGTETPAGRQGAIYRVTRVSDTIPPQEGELRWAVEATEPRVVVFETSGTITLKRELVVREPFITIAGQSAPSPGITLKGRRLRVATHDVLIQHLRLRPGDQDTRDPDYTERDGVTLADPGQGQEIYNVVIDRCSLSWAPDELVGIGAKAGEENIHDVTVSNSILAESLLLDGGDSVGASFGAGSNRISLLGNFLASNRDGNPLFRGGSAGIFVNNLVYNGGDAQPARVLMDVQDGAVQASIAGNLFREGPSGGPLTSLIRFTRDRPVGSFLYAEDNVVYGPGGELLSLPLVNSEELVFDPTRPVSPLPMNGITVRPSGEVEHSALKAGARPGERDSVDLRLVETYHSRGGAILRSPSEVGGWPKLAVNTRPFLAPLNPGGDDDGDGYTNLEEVLHAGAFAVAAPPAEASCSDGVLNGTETGVDCGGSCASCAPRGITEQAGFRLLEAGEFNHYPTVVRIAGGTRNSPVVLDRGDTEYILDGNITAPETAFVLKASNITLDLNGKTVTYHTAGTGQQFGIRADVSVKNIHIVNGTIRQSSNASLTDLTLKGSSAIGSTQAENGIQNVSINESLFAGLKIFYRTASTCGISFMWASGNEVKYCTFTDHGYFLQKTFSSGSSYWDRQANFAAVRFSRNGGIIHHNQVVKARQCGFTVGNNSKVFQNDINLLSRHTNSAGVTGYAVHDVEVYNNTITGTGAHLFGALFGAGGYDVRIHHNNINLSNSATVTNQWESAYHGANGFRTSYGLSRSAVAHNTIVIGVREVPAYPRQCEGQGLSIGLEAADAGVVIEDNDVQAKSLDGIPRATALALHDHKGGGLEIRNNLLKSNHSIVAVSTDYGECRGYPLIRENSFVKLGSSPSFKTIIMNEYISPQGERTARFVGNGFGPGTSFFDVAYPTTYRGALNDISLEYDFDLRVLDAAGEPAAGQAVEIRDNTGTIRFSGTTDAEGRVKTPLVQLWLTSRDTGPAQYFTSEYVGSLNRIDLNPYTVAVGDVTRALVLEKDVSMTIELPGAMSVREKVLEQIGDRAGPKITIPPAGSGNPTL